MKKTAQIFLLVLVAGLAACSKKDNDTILLGQAPDEPQNLYYSNDTTAENDTDSTATGTVSTG